MVALWLFACVFYTDADRDRDGDGERAVAFGGEDCDDGNAAIHPAAVEVCNLRDDDCDGSIDDDASDATEWFADHDGDGIGGETVMACYAADGLSSAKGDCDDENAAVFPGAVEDICTEADEDCDGEGGAGGLLPNARLGGEAGGVDGLGAAIDVGQADGAGEVVLAGSAEAGVTLVFALEEATDSDSSERWARIIGGGDTVAIGDAFVVDADTDDVIIGDAGWNEGRGRVGIFQLAQTGGDHDWDVVTAWWEAPGAGDALGAGMAFFQGDGVYSSILMLGAPGTDEGRGAVYILQLNAAGESGFHTVETSSYGIVTSRDYVVGAGLGESIGGWSDAAGGLYGAYGAPGQQGRLGLETGAMALSAIGTIDILNTATQVYVGADGGDRFSHAITGGDVDGDGLNELVVSAPGRDTDGGDDAGTVYVLAGSLLNENVDSSDLEHEMSEASLVLEGDAEGRVLGRAVEMNGHTLLVSGNLASCEGEDPGVVYAFDLSAAGTYTISDTQRVIVGEPGAKVGESLLLAGTELWVGEPGASRVERFSAE